MKWKTSFVRMRTAKSLAEHYNIDSDQARRVWETTEVLYQQWRAQNAPLESQQLAALLKWTAQRHEVGLYISSGMQGHLAYILQQKSDLPGFNQEQQLLAGALSSQSDQI